MAKSQQTETTSALEPEKVIRTLTEAQSAGLGSLSWLGTKWLETMGDVGAEWLSFVADRVKEDVKTQHELLHAKSLSQVQHIQARFLKKAMDDYNNETGKIVNVCSSAMSEMHERAVKEADQPKT